MKQVALAIWFVWLFGVSAFGQEAKLMLPIGHTFLVMDAQFSPDGKEVVTCSADNTAKIWESKTGLLLADLKGHEALVEYSEFSPDGKKILTASDDGTIKIWDAKTSQLLATFHGSSTIHYAEFSPDGTKIVAASADSTAKIWDVKTGKILTTLNGYKGDVYLALFSPDGKKIITTCADKTTKIWDTESYKLLINLKDSVGTGASAKFSPNGKKFITNTNNGAVKIWDTENGAFLTALKGHSTITHFSADNKQILTSESDGTAKIWDAENGTLLNSLKGPGDTLLNAQFCQSRFSHDGKKIVTVYLDLVHQVPTINVWDVQASTLMFSLDVKRTANVVYNVEFSPDDKTIVSSSSDNNAKIWDANTGKLLTELTGHAFMQISAHFSPDTKKIITTSFDKTVKIWDAQRGKLLYSFGVSTVGVNGAQFSGDGKTILTSSPDGTAKIWDAETKNLLLDIKGHTQYVVSAQFSNDGKKVVTSSYDKTVKIWDGKTGTLLKSIDAHNGPVRVAQFSPDDKKIVSTSFGSVRIWDAETKQLLTDIKVNNIYRNDIYNAHSNDLGYAQFSPDGKEIVTTSLGDSTTYIRNSVTGEITGKLKSQRVGSFSAVFSPNGKMIATTIANFGVVEIWDAKADTLLFGLEGHTGILTTSVQFSADNKRLVTASNDNTCKVWDVIKGKLLYTFFQTGVNDYLVTDQYGRYDGTEAARKLLYFTCGTEVIGLDQVKDQLWVPNLAERIMKGDSINAPKLSDLDICALTPQVEREEKQGYHFNITPRRGGLGDVVLLVNDIEVKRYKVAQLTKTAIGYELNVNEQELQPYFIAGKENPVTVKAYTEKNDISSRGVVIMQDETKKQKVAPNLYAVMIGVSDYKGPELQLKYAAKDATDISAALAASAGKLLGKEHVFTYNLTTAKDHYQLPEKIAIKNTLAEIGKKATANDILLIFFAGHGVTSGEKKQFYFLTADASQASATDAPDKVGISTKELSEWMQPSNIKAQKRILILDACNSGQAIKEIVKIGGADQTYLAARNDDKAEQIKAIDKLNEKSGLFILAASASNQSAYEMGRYSQGLLTYSLLKAIKQQPDILEDNKYLNVSRWFNAAEKTVSDMVRETGNRQEPQIVSAGNFNIGVVDPEVMAGIKLAEDKPLFTACNLQNNDPEIAADNLHLNALLDNQLNEISARGDNNGITYIPGSASPDAYSLGGRYELKGDLLTLKVNIRQNDATQYKFELTGKKDDLKNLAEKVVNQATDWILKKK